MRAPPTVSPTVNTDPNAGEPDIARETAVSDEWPMVAPIPPAARIATFVHDGTLRKSWMASVTTSCIDSGAEGTAVSIDDRFWVSGNAVCAARSLGDAARASERQLAT